MSNLVQTNPYQVPFPAGFQDILLNTSRWWTFTLCKSMVNLFHQLWFSHMGEEAIELFSWIPFWPPLFSSMESLEYCLWG